MNVIRRIQTFNAGRDPERLQLEYRAMRSSNFTFLRATCHLFYDRLPRSEAIFGKSAPAVWMCGDLHLENVGSYKADNRLVYFDLNDFDEAALAPASWELVRFLSSVWIAAEQFSVPHADALALGQRFLSAYAGALAQGKAYWVERDTATGIVHDLLDGLRERQRPAFLNARSDVLKGKKRVLRVDGKKALPVTDEQRARVADFMNKFAATQHKPGFFKMLDVARRIAGTGSLGVDRYAILVEGKGSPDGNYLLDLKEARPTALARHLKLAQPEWVSEAERVVTLQRRVQAVSMAFLQPVQMGAKSYVLRGLQPSEDRVTLNPSRHGLGEFEQLMDMIGRLVAWGQLRSAGREGSANADELIDFARGKKWQARLLKASQACAEQVRKDAAVYNQAWDEGQFDV